jgi:hypothetical protein
MGTILTLLGAMIAIAIGIVVCGVALGATIKMYHLIADGK